MVDLEWNRKTIFEKLDWLKETLEAIIAKANHNITVQQGQLRAITARLAALEKPVRKSASMPRGRPVKKSIRRNRKPEEVEAPKKQLKGDRRKQRG